MRFLKIFLVLVVVCNLQAQDVMMQGWYWDYPKTAAGESFVDTLISKSTELSEAGITHLWLPPLSRASFGSGSNGYDPQDLYDLGEYGLGPTGFGTRTKVDNLISTLNAKGIAPVADVVYNHRDGGKAENNPAVEGWIENYNCTKKNSGDQPFPSDRVRYILPIGGSTGLGMGDYFFKVRSVSTHPDFFGREYKFYVETNVRTFAGDPALQENEANNDGGGCGQGNDFVPFGTDMIATIDGDASCDQGSPCGFDEFKVYLDNADFNAAGDTMYIYMNNTGAYSDHAIIELYSTSAAGNIQSQIIAQTYTDFTSLPSGQGAMNYLNFKPNGNPTNLSGDWDSMLFFYDYDQSQADTQDKLIDWTKWLWSDVGIRGLRMDAVKHFDPAFVGQMMNEVHDLGQNHSMVVGEFFDTNAGALKGWVDAVENNMDAETKAAMDIRIFDFALRQSLEAASDAFGYDVRNIFDSGIVNGANGAAKNVVTFANNHDYRDENQPIDNDPLLAYAYLLTNRTVGTPTIFYPDYYGTSLPHGPSDALKEDIDVLLSVYNQHMDGGTTNYLNNISSPGIINYYSEANGAGASTTLIYQTYDGGSAGNQDAIVVINYAGETLDVEFAISGNSSKTAGTVFREVTGKSFSSEVVLDGDSRLRVALPARSYGIWVDGEIDIKCITGNRLFVDDSALGLNNGSSWENAFLNLESAMNYADQCPDINEIWLKEGSYKASFFGDRSKSFLTNSKLKILGGFPQGVNNPVLGDRDPSTFETTLEGDIGVEGDQTDNTNNTLTNNSLDTVIIDGVTFANANADSEAGAGIINVGKLVLNNVVIRNATSSTEGSALLAKAGSYTELNNCTFENNSGQSQLKVEDGAKVKVNGLLLEE